ncbi:hypothetical protein GWO43_18465 [candidate division KSB1 bacterium]|nr:hypothetical protein [candidate division KSB1 bacterium]NIT72820.1 hypothetical protein [candidate division KSB1 bacterium]NIV70472.1 hypothetical protein [Phycisphaerae bacterium]NIW70052.1 hypothetical protein [candidate division KSB1 bacterium]NIX72500.1 hypothetical protein [candidate division KSB1 bacterium]
MRIMRRVLAITLVTSIVFSPVVFAQSFQGLGDLPGGTVASSGYGRLCRWQGCCGS